MIRGFFQKRYDKMCNSIYLTDEEKRIAYTFEMKAHALKPNEYTPSTDIDLDDGLGILRALAQALQMGGFIPKSAVDAELKAVKNHLDDMRLLAGVKTKRLEDEH